MVYFISLSPEEYMYLVFDVRHYLQEEYMELGTVVYLKT
jgi:hypothetical protein